MADSMQPKRLNINNNIDQSKTVLDSNESNCSCCLGNIPVFVQCIILYVHTHITHHTHIHTHTLAHTTHTRKDSAMSSACRFILEIRFISSSLGLALM